MLKDILLYVAIFTFLGSTLIAWYEGSTIMNDPLEWDYSTPFTELFHGEMKDGKEINQLDYFVYAAKFHPTFPSFIIASLYFILCILGYHLIKRKSKWTLTFWSSLSFFILLLASFLFKSTTISGGILFYIVLATGLCSISVLVYVSLKNVKSKVVKNNGH